MPRKSERVTSAHQLLTLQLMNECRELGDDAVAWQQHLIAGLIRLTGGVMAAVGPTPSHQTGQIDAATDWVGQQLGGGWPSNGVRQRWETLFSDPAVLAQHPAAVAFYSRPEPELALVRSQMVDDQSWDRSSFVNEILRFDGFDEGLIARSDVSATGSGYMLTVVRAKGERPFAVRIGLLVAALQRELKPHLGRALLLTTQPNRHGLTPRQREVLDCLLEGDSEKQAALRLGVATATVHVHIKRLYAHFGVSSRAELLAYFLKRYRWPATAGLQPDSTSKPGSIES